MRRHAFLDAHEILPNLWQGAYPPEGSVLESAGFHVLVLCARELQSPASSFPGVQVIHAPNDDNPHLPLDRHKLQGAIEAARQVSAAIQLGRRVLVTCAAGLNRSGLVSALTLHLLLGWPGSQCVTHVQKRRQSRAMGGRNALCNGEFVQALCRLEARPVKPPVGVTAKKTPGGLWLP